MRILEFTAFSGPSQHLAFLTHWAMLRILRNPEKHLFCET